MRCIPRQEWEVRGPGARKYVITRAPPGACSFFPQAGAARLATGRPGPDTSWIALRARTRRARSAGRRRAGSTTGSHTAPGRRTACRSKGHSPRGGEAPRAVLRETPRVGIVTVVVEPEAPVAVLEHDHVV